MTRTTAVMVSILLIMTVTLAACGGEQQVADDQHIIIATNNDPPTFDPAKSNDGASILVWNQIYDTLVAYDYENNELVPAIAEDWEAIDDTTVRFYIREGIKFHDGSELTAEDVAFSIDRLIDPDTASPAAYLLNVIEDITVDDEHTVTFTLQKPYAPTLYHFTHPSSSIVSKARVEAEGEDHFEEPMGTGVFKFESYSRGDRVVLVRNEDYWDGAPKPERVTIRIIPEDSTQVAEIEAGGVHVAFNIPTHEVARLEETPDVYIVESLGYGIVGLVLNLQREPLENVKVRQALNYAIDRTSIVEDVDSGFGQPASQLLAPTVFGHHPDLEPYPYDPDKSRELLAEAGYPDGFEASILVWNMDRYVRFAEVIQAQFADVGVDVELDVIEFGAALERGYEGDFDMTTMQWGTTTLDGDYTMYPLLHSDNWGQAGNWGCYSNEEVDELIYQAQVNPDPEVRLEAYQRASEIAFEDAAWVFSHHDFRAYAVHQTLKDVRIPVSYININLKDAYIGD
ncbi:MAG: ABC transporter substrate-binding protein [Bacillota bacterium]